MWNADGESHIVYYVKYYYFLGNYIYHEQYVHIYVYILVRSKRTTLILLHAGFQLFSNNWWDKIYNIEYAANSTFKTKSMKVGISNELRYCIFLLKL